MSKDRYSILFTILAALLLAACQQQAAAPPFECTDAIGCVTIEPDEPIKIGVMQALSGDLEPIGREQLQSAELAVADRAGELLGHPIEIISEDSLCSGEGGTTAGLKLVADPQLLAVVGTTCSGAAVNAARVLSEAGLSMISSSNTAPSLTAVEGQQGADWQPGYFRTAYNDADQGRAAATFAFQELGIRKAATIDDGDAYTQGLANVFSRVFAELGGEIVLEGAINKGDTDMKPVLEAVATAGAELIFFPIFQPEGDFITLQAKEVPGLDEADLMVADGLLVGPFIEAIGESGAGMSFVGPATPTGASYERFVAAYQSEYNPVETPYHAHAYDATNLILTAIETVAVGEENGVLHIGRQALRDALAGTAGYEGLTGTLNCQKFGDCGAARFKIVRLDDPAAGIEGLIENVVYTYTPLAGE